MAKRKKSTRGERKLKNYLKSMLKKAKREGDERAAAFAKTALTPHHREFKSNLYEARRQMNRESGR